MAERPKRWTCVEAGCSYELTAADVPSAIEAAQRHIAEAHGSFELEEMIEDVLEDVPESTAGQTSRAARSPGKLRRG
jgi:predicted small metal-binding protein